MEEATPIVWSLRGRETMLGPPPIRGVAPAPIEGEG